MSNLPLGPFTYIRVEDPASDKAQVMNEMRHAFFGLLNDIEKLCPDGRYKSLAKTALEESSLWAQRGLALDYE